MANPFEFDPDVAMAGSADWAHLKASLLRLVWASNTAHLRKRAAQFLDSARYFHARHGCNDLYRSALKDAVSNMTGACHLADDLRRAQDNRAKRFRPCTRPLNWDQFKQPLKVTRAEKHRRRTIRGCVNCGQGIGARA